MNLQSLEASVYTINDKYMIIVQIKAIKVICVDYPEAFFNFLK